MSVSTSDANDLAFGQTPLEWSKVVSFSVDRTTTKSKRAAASSS